MKTKTTPTLNVVIDKSNYDRAITASSGSCLIADAIREQYPKFSKIRVDVATIRFSDKSRGERYIYLTPSRVAEALLAFDQGWKEEHLPVKFNIRTALKVVPIIRSISDVKIHAEKRAKRLLELEEKEKTPEGLNKREKSILERMRKPKVERPVTGGPSTTETVKGETVVYGGAVPKLNKHNANLLHGRDRHFGAKTAQPSEVFKRAVQHAVKAERAKRKPKTEDNTVPMALNA